MVGGHYQYRVRRRISPAESADHQQAAARGARRTTSTTFQEYTDLIDEQNRNLCTLRGLLKLKYADEPIPLDEVEPAKEIVKRFTTGAMSLRLDQQGSARDARHRHEPHRRQVEHRRRRRRRSALQARCQRRSRAAAPSSRSPRPLRRHHQLPGQRRRAADQDGAGRQARRRRPAARPQGG